MIRDWARQRAFYISETSQVAEVRRFATQLAEASGLSQSDTGKTAIIATELSTNLIKHAHGGQMIVRLLTDRDRCGVELLSLDHGPGIADFALWLRDGYSTAGSYGTGLGAVRRLATYFDIHSVPDKGTAVLAQFWVGERTIVAPTEIEVGAVCISMPGQERCGDACSYEAMADRCIFVLADGLGHGLAAAEAAQEAITRVHERIRDAPADMVEYAHNELRRTRGAALAVAEVSLSEQLIRYCGIGNISSTVITATSVCPMRSYEGTAGHAVRKIAEFTYLWAADSLLIMHSDGLMTHWDLQAYPGLLQRHPSIIAGVLFRDFARGRDDVTVLAAKVAPRIL